MLITFVFYPDFISFFSFVCLCPLEIDFKLLFPQAEVKLLANISKFIGKVKTPLVEDTGYGDEGIPLKNIAKKGFVQRSI